MRNGIKSPALALGGRPLGWDDPSYVAGSDTLQTKTPGLSDYANPTTVAYMKKMWPGSGSVTNQLGNYTANASSGGNNYQFVTHIDHDINDHNHLSGRYAWWDNINLRPILSRTASCA